MSSHGVIAWGRSHRHGAVRIIAVGNMLLLGGLQMNATVFRGLSRSGLLGAVSIWLILSSLSLPAYVVVQPHWVRGTPAEGRAFLVDFTLAAAWFVLFWAFAAWAWTHGAII